MSHFSIKGKSPGIYMKIDSVERKYNFKESLINQPLILSQSHNILNKAHKNMLMDKENKTSLNVIYNMRSNAPSNFYGDTNIKYPNNENNFVNVGLCFEDNLDPNSSITEEIPHSYQHSQLNRQGPHMKSNHQFFWKMSYEPKQIVSSRFWGSFNKKEKILKADNIDEISELERKLRSGLSSKRPTTKQSFRETKNTNYNNIRPHTSSSATHLNFKEYGNDIEEFEYNAPKLLKHTNFIDNFKCPHGLTNLRKKEASYFERANGFLINKSSIYDPYVVEFQKKIKGGRRKKSQKKSLDNNGFDRAVYEQNFGKARSIMGKSLENFNK